MLLENILNVHILEEPVGAQMVTFMKNGVEIFTTQKPQLLIQY